MSYKKNLLTASLVCAWLVTAAFPARAESLEDAVVTALNQHPTVIAALANRDALKQERREYVSDFFPEVNMSATAGRIYGDNSTSRGLSVTRGTGYSYLGEGSVSVRQTIFDGFETLNRVGAAGARHESANYNILDVRENLSLRAVVSYMDVLRNREAIAKLQAYSGKLKDYLKRIEGMVEEGAADAAMAVQARDIQAQLDNTLAGLEGQLRGSEAEYAEIVGHPADSKMTRPGARNETLPKDVDEAVKLALDTHPMLRAARLTAEASDLDTKAEKGAFFPDLTGEVSYLKRDQADVIGGEAVDARALVRMNWTLQTGGEQLARMRKASYRHAESRAEAADQMRQIERQVRAAFSELDTTAQQLKIMNDRLKINKDLFETQESQFEAARVTLLQLMQTDNALFNADLALLNGEYRHLAAQYALLASMGRLQDALNVIPAAMAQAKETSPAVPVGGDHE